MQNDEHVAALIKTVVAWLGTGAGFVLARIENYLTLSNMVMLATLMFTVLNIYVLLRDRIFNRRRGRES